MVQQLTVSSGMETLVSKPVGPVGLGLMGMSWRPEPPSAEDCYETMSTALAQGVNFWNGGELYGKPDYHSCHILNGYFTRNPEQADRVVLSIKGGMVPDTLNPDGTEKNVRRSVEECIKILDGKKSIDTFECARVDPNTPIEETVSVLAQLVKERKIGGIGLSEVRADTIERAHAIHPIAIVEVELSLWSTDILGNGVAATCGRLGIPVAAYSPLSQGAMAGRGIRKNSDIPDGDWRKTLPKFQDDVLEQNNRIFDEVDKLAKQKGVTKAQIAIAWVKGCGNRVIRLRGGELVKTGSIIPIPGATKPDRVKENSKLVDLTEGEMHQIEEILRRNPVNGDRYTKGSMAICEG